jgi:hypothetical protein
MPDNLGDCLRIDVLGGARAAILARMIARFGDSGAQAKAKYNQSDSCFVTQAIFKESHTMIKRVQIPNPNGGAPVDGYEAPAVESTERWTDVTLEDGTCLRIKASVVSAVRMEGHFDPDGNPMYAVKSNLQVVLSHVPDQWKRSFQSTMPN